MVKISPKYYNIKKNAKRQHTAFATIWTILQETRIVRDDGHSTATIRTFFFLKKRQKLEISVMVVIWFIKREANRIAFPQDKEVTAVTARDLI